MQKQLRAFIRQHNLVILLPQKKPKLGVHYEMNVSLPVAPGCQQEEKWIFHLGLVDIARIHLSFITNFDFM